MRISSLIVVLFAVLGLAQTTEKANAGLFIGISVAPPPLPVYVQPPIPGPGYIWTPGYWAWNADFADYYWVPGAWVPAPSPGLLWTPGYWAWSDGAYVWNAGYWGPHVGFYGGVCYGFGYTGSGFAGGYWSGGSFYYNRSVTNITNTTIVTNVYSQTVINNATTKVSYNGGNGGLRVQPTPQELQAANEQHIAPTRDQLDHQKFASENRDLRASVNKGKPAIAAVAKAGDFSPRNVIAAKAAGGPIKPASLAAGHGLNNGRPTGQNQDGHAFTAKTHSAPNLAAKPNGAPGAMHLDASHGTNKNAVANLNGGFNDRRGNLGPNAGPMHGAPQRVGAATMPKRPGGPGPNGQPHFNGPRPTGHAAQPHPSGPQKKDQHRG